jgi:crotonobetaine/carnitine-CoA ligase
MELYDGSPENPTSEVAFYDPMVIMYTSGTTGASKGVILSHAHFYAVAWEEIHFLHYTEDSIIYSCLPLFHANASMASQGAILAEGIFAIGKRFSLSGFWDEIRKYGATHTSILGTISPLLWRQPRREGDSKNPLKVVFVSPLIPEFKEFEKRFGLKLITMYGLTESGIVTVSPGSQAWFLQQAQRLMMFNL